MSGTPGTTRALRVVRGSGAALIATLIAAASHSLAGGSVSVVSLVATSVLALPVCVALAGRIGSLWRLGVAVSAAQFLYHWVFAGLGTGSGLGAGIGVSPDFEPAPFHAAHIAALQAFVPQATDAAAADTLMWAGHAVAAALTVALLHRGERAALSLLRLVLRALPFGLPSAVPAPRRPGLRAIPRRVLLRDRLTVLSAISHRGPPALPAPTN